jgi:energy-coupling factor transport system permease protein
MLKNISFGIYYPGNSLLHRLQARTKLLLLGWFAVFSALANRHAWHFAPYITLAALVFLATALAGISAGQMWQRMRILVFFAIFGALLTPFSRDSGSKPLYTIGPYAVSFGVVHWAIILYGALLTAYIILSLLPVPALRDFLQGRRLKGARILLIPLTLGVIVLLWFIHTIPLSKSFPVGPFIITDTGTWALISLFTVFLVLYAFSLLLTMTTSPISLIEGLTLLLTPLRWLRLPVDDFALMTLIALRFIPTLFEEVEQLLKAQMSRGADYAHGTIRERVQSMVALFVPLLQAVLRRAADLATSLEARGYEVEGRQTFLHETSFGMIDYAVLGVVVVVTLGALIL